MAPIELRSANELKVSVSDPGQALIRVRPRVFFQLAEQHLSPNATICLPIPSSSIGSVTTLEATIMATILRLHQPKSVVEFGTFLGYSTRLFLLNTNKASVVSVDLPEFEVKDTITDTPSDTRLRTDGKFNDEYLRHQQARLGHPYLSELPNEDRARLTLLKADSRSLTVADFTHGYTPQFIFIDGGHDEITVSSDSELALSLLGGSGIIIWHDYESSIHDGVTSFLRRWSEAPQLLSVSGTMLAIAYIGEARDHLLSLLP